MSNSVSPTSFFTEARKSFHAALLKSVLVIDAEEMLNTMIDGKRLRDVSDLPLDLVI